MGCIPRWYQSKPPSSVISFLTSLSSDMVVELGALELEPAGLVDDSADDVPAEGPSWG